ncbi:GPI anchored dioxygenase-like protein [Massarina eburnea CBS 473.64]|uniref:GPI anchored dioxygenase-like protein n=1 Tax=Massarina eburnea CBS 473.64 TaxID=1395130 RepID=A0A6A6RUQ5_9PLEO|nr:GPI anchored dioxygenase-like protein [Massarina eburnea CBS 473.64]
MVALQFLTAMLAAPLVLAHPGETAEAVKREMAMRNIQHAKATRALGECQNSAQSLALRRDAAVRRAVKAQELRAKRGLSSEQMNHQKRDLTNLEIYANTSHNQTEALQYTLDSAETTIFGSNNTCALVPETTIGPYYVTGESIRSNITEGQAGIPMHIDIQFVDQNTCLGVDSIAADVWHCNSTGSYSGVAAEGEGGVDSTFLRGVQISDDSGVVAFDTLFPGHYDDRVTHFHLVVQSNYTTLPNSTYIDGRTLHIGQIYFEDTLVKAVEETYPYNTNTIAYTTWEEDGWMLEEATTDYDPFVEYVQLGDKLEDGLLAWITVALDLNSDHTANVTGGAAAHYYEGGGVAVENSDKGLPPSNPNAQTPS